MANIGKLEYRVVPVTRYQITRHHETVDGRTGGTEQKGEYANEEVAFEVATALCRAEHERLSLPLGDERIQYPKKQENRCTVNRIGNGLTGATQNYPIKTLAQSNLNNAQ